MALQNVRSLLWRAEDLGFGNGNAREYVIPITVPAAARPVMFTRAFAGSCDVTALLAVTSPWPTNGKQRVIVNRNPRYWITVAGTMNTTAVGTGNAASFPIAPLQMFFLPVNFAATTVTANSAWPIAQPLTGSPGATVPLATTTTQLTFDILGEA